MVVRYSRIQGPCKHLGKNNLMTGNPSLDKGIRVYKEGEMRKGSLCEALILFYFWLEADLCLIRDQNSDIVPLRPNLSQKVVLGTMIKQALAGKPVRIIILKARKVGCSTFVQCLFFFLCRHYPNRLAITLAHETRATSEIFEITKRVAAKYLIEADSRHNEIEFKEQESRYYCHTAGGLGVGAGSTPNFLHLSEVPKWPAHGMETEYTATEAVPEELVTRTFFTTR